MKAGKLDDGSVLDLNSAFEAVGAYESGKIDEKRLHEIECNACPGGGSCSGMFTANSMNCLTEALGLSLPGNGSIVATHANRENRFRNQIAKNHLQSFMLDIYDKCYRYFDRQEIEGGSRQDEIFKNFIALVHENCISQREVTFYASKLCISTKYLTGICKSVTGEAAKKIIDDFAILEIKVLLQSTGLTIQEIADRLGFPDQSYLGRYFKRHEGMSPKEYQSKYSI
jgi:AraC-like DNA-binding protein